MIAANMMDTGFTSVALDEAATEAVRALADAPWAASVPVVDSEGVLAGEVSACVLLARAATAEASTGVEGLGVTDVMDKAPLTTGPEAGVRELAAMLGDGNGGRTVHVVDDSGRLLGVITPGVMVERLCQYMEKTR